MGEWIGDGWVDQCLRFFMIGSWWAELHPVPELLCAVEFIVEKLNTCSVLKELDSLVKETRVI